MAYIIQRGKKWYVCYNVNGKHRRKVVGPSKKKAQEAARILEGKIATGDLNRDNPFDDSPLFKDALKTFLNQRRGRRTPVEQTYYRLINEWKPEFADWRLNEITAGGIYDRLERWEKKRKWSGSTYNAVLSSIHVFLEWAKKIPRCYIKENPAKHVERRKVNNARDRVLSVEETLKLLAESPPWLRDIIEFAVHTGKRQAEILNLTKGDYKVNDGVATLKISKTKNGDPAYVTLTGALHALVLRRVAATNFPGEYLFPGPKGKSALTALKRTFPKVVEKAGMIYGMGHPDGVVFHTLRHTAATIFLNNGMSMEEVQKELNHKTSMMTQRYAKLVEQRTKSKACDIMDNVFQFNGGTTTNLQGEGQ